MAAVKVLLAADVLRAFVNPEVVAEEVELLLTCGYVGEFDLMVETGEYAQFMRDALHAGVAPEALLEMRHAVRAVPASEEFLQLALKDVAKTCEQEDITPNASPEVFAAYLRRRLAAACGASLVVSMRGGGATKEYTPESFFALVRSRYGRVYAMTDV